MGKRLIVLLVLVSGLILTGGSAMRSIVVKMLFSNKRYAADIDMETYLISEEKLAEVLSDHWMQKLSQQPQRELVSKPVYLVIRVTNKGRYSAWGLLSCQVNSGNFKVYIHTVPFKRWFNYIIPLGEFTWATDREFPEITVQWEKLYTK